MTCVHAAVYVPMFSSTGVRTEAAIFSARTAPDPGT
jgi:hypothetical protein